MADFSHPNILKLGKSKLDVHVRQTRSFEYHPPYPCPSDCSASPLHITFYTHSKHRFLDPRRVSLSSPSNSSALIAEHLMVVGSKTICQDGSLFFTLQETINSKVAVKTALRSLKVKRSRYGRILKKVMAFGRRYNKDCNEKKKKVLKGLTVIITVEQSFMGERDAVHEVMEKSYEESKARARGDEDILLCNSSLD